MNLGKAIYFILSNDSDLSTAGVDIFPVMAKETNPFPFLTYEINQDDPVQTKDGTSTMGVYRLECLVFDEEYNDLCTISGYVKTALERVPTYPSSTYNGVVLQSIEFDTISDDYDDKSGERGVYRQRLVFTIRQIIS